MKVNDLNSRFFENNEFLKMLVNVRQYFFKISYAEIIALSMNERKTIVTNICVNELTQWLQDKGLHGLERITTNQEDDNRKDVRIIYSDDTLDFGIIISTSKIEFIKERSTMAELLETISEFAGLFYKIYNKVNNYLKRDNSADIIPLGVYHNFEFMLEDFKTFSSAVGRGRPVSNKKIMEAILPVENDNSPIKRIGFENIGRTQVTLSGFITNRSIPWNIWLLMDSPGNKNYSTMSLDINIRHEMSKRTPFNQDSINQIDVVFIELFKNKVVKEFLETLFKNIEFTTLRSK